MSAPTQRGAPAIETDGLSKRYRRTWALQDCTFSVPAGRIAALVGPNGAGKSTLLRILAGLSTPSAGTVSVLGEERASWNRAHMDDVGYLDQDRPLYRGFTVEEMLRFGKVANARWDDDRARAHLDDLGISRSSRVGELSGGQKAQVALTVCLATHPPLLLLDEPVAALDPVAREDVMHVLLQAIADDGTTVLLSRTRSPSSRRSATIS